MPFVTQSRIKPRVVATGSYFYAGRSAKTEAGGAPGTVFEQGTETTTGFRGSADSDYERLSGEQIRESLRREYKLRYDTGHEFSTTKRALKWPEWQHAARVEGYENINSKNYSVVYVGDLVPQPNSGSLYGGATLPTAADLAAYGRAAISRTAPTKPEASLAQFLGELKQQVPELFGAQLLKHGANRRTVGGEYLNAEFGWRPMVSDVQKFARSAARAHELTLQFVRDSDKVVRRGTTLLDEEVSTTSFTTTATVRMPRVITEYPTPHVVGTELLLFAPTYSSMPARVQETVRKKVYFRGAYQYHVAEGHQFLDKLERYEQQINHLLGTRINADLVWELTPWSWLLDWFGDFGTFVRNVTLLSSDSLVLRYGYVMAETTVKRTMRAEGLRARDPGTSGMTTSSPRELEVSGFTTTKQRARATPYGFGLKSSSFSARQWAILAALGLTKGDRVGR